LEILEFIRFDLRKNLLFSWKEIGSKKFSLKMRKGKDYDESSSF